MSRYCFSTLVDIPQTKSKFCTSFTLTRRSSMSFNDDATSVASLLSSGEHVRNVPGDGVLMVVMVFCEGLRIMIVAARIASLA